MRMSNLLCVDHIFSRVMAVNRSPVGISHLTVIPANYDAEQAKGRENSKAEDSAPISIQSSNDSDVPE